MARVVVVYDSLSISVPYNVQLGLSVSANSRTVQPPSFLDLFWDTLRISTTVKSLLMEVTLAVPSSHRDEISRRKKRSFDINLMGP